MKSCELDCRQIHVVTCISVWLGIHKHIEWLKYIYVLEVKVQGLKVALGRYGVKYQSFIIAKNKIDTCNVHEIAYCERLIFRGVLIFVVFVEGPKHEFQYMYPRNFPHEL